MTVLDNISSVAKYESKLLMRSWFYRVFLILAIIFLCIYNFSALISGDSGAAWLIKAIPSNIPYANLLFLNTGQAIIAVFLSSEFLKADKKLDTSEVFYVHPLSNAEYVIGKIWGNLNVFFRLNLLILLIVAIFNLASGVQLDWLAYITYFLLISIPTLIYIFGLSVALMLILKNQAITFVILLGYIGITVFYIKAKFYYLFDYMVYNLPLVKSTIVGFSNWGVLVNHRCIYLLLGLGFLCVSIFLFRRLPNTKYGRYRWLALSAFLFFAGGVAAYNHVSSILKESKNRALYTDINNKYVNTPKMVIENYDIKLEQHPATISSEVEMKGVALENAAVFTFCLNPGLHVREVMEKGKELSFKRESQIILIDFGREIDQGDAVSFIMKYDGSIDEDFCYLDIPSEILQEEYSSEVFNIDKKYSFHTNNYLLLTPETYWYPRPGTSYSSESPDWQQAYFSRFRLTVKTMNGLQALSQGTLKFPAVRNIAPSTSRKMKKPVVKEGISQGQGGNFGGGPGGIMGGNQQGPPGNFQGRPGGPGGRGPGGPGGQAGRAGGGRDSLANQRQIPEGMRDSIANQRRRFQEGEANQGQRQIPEGMRDSIANQRRRFQEGEANQGQRQIPEGMRDSIANQRRRFQEGDIEPGQRRGPGGGIPDSIANQRRRFQNNDSDTTRREIPVIVQDSIFIFETDFPSPSLTLVIGDYEQKSVDVDGTEFTLWHLRGHDYFYPFFEDIPDTIPGLINNTKLSIETQYMLDYSYNRFSVVEVPVQLYSYVRTWTQAQEIMQPEMVLFPENGCLFNEVDFFKRYKDQKLFSRRNGQEISDEDIAIRMFNNFMWIFRRSESNDRSMDRGAINISVKPNPYFIFPQLYNFRYNIFSSEWPISNRVIEIYLQDRSDNDSRIRQMNGISNNEKANLLMQKRPFKDLLADVERRDLLDNIVALKANSLFAPAERNMGYNEYRDSLRAVLQRNIFTNLRFENLLDTMSMISGEDLLTPLRKWNYPTVLPAYVVGRPEVIRITNRDVEVYTVSLQLTNDSDIGGIVNVQINVGGAANMRGGGGFGGGGFGGFGGGGFMMQSNPATYDPRMKRKVSLAAGETKQLVSVWEDAPRNIIVNTLISANLPSVINLPISNIIRERNIPIPAEGDFIIGNVSYNSQGEIIVDNEDTHLFELSKPDIVGLLPQWLEEVGDNSFPYTGVSGWRPPLQWTLTTNDKYFGDHVRSAYVIKSGNGSQTATWKIPVPSAGLYDLFYYVTKPENPRGRMDQFQQQGGNNRGGGPGGGGGGNNRSGDEYQFKVKYDDVVESAYINLRRSDEGWSILGTYFLSEDTMSVTLSNNTKSNMVIADAVKIVKRQ